MKRLLDVALLLVALTSAAPLLAQAPPLAAGDPPPPKAAGPLSLARDVPLAPAAPGETLVLHAFDADAQGWYKQYDCPPLEAQWNPSGFIAQGDACFTDPPPPPPYGCIYWHWQAPSSFVVPARGGLGGTLSFDLKLDFPTPGTLGTNGLDVAIFGPDITPGAGRWIALYGVVTELHTAWRTYTIRLDETSPWVEWGDPGTPIPPEVVRHVIANMVSVHFRGAYKSQCEVGNGSSLDNVKVIAAGTPAAEPLAISTETLTPTPEDGWYAENPVTVRVHLSNPGSAPLAGDFELTLFSDDERARFFIYESTLVDGDPGVAINREFHSLHSLKLYKLTRTGTTLAPGEEETLEWKLWGQPSELTTLRANLSWQATDHQKAVAVETAAIHPVVFVHGIQGSQPPQDLLIRRQDLAQRVLDPYTNGYAPLLEQLAKIGYEWDKTLFALAYDWRTSNDRSALHLRQELAAVVIPQAAAVPYCAFFGREDGKADLVAHSMGGLVSRAYVQGSAYAGNVRKLVTIGTPHEGFAFDYRTWEGATWKDYMQDADTLPGPVAPVGFWLAADYLLWPFQATESYAPSRTELAPYRWYPWRRGQLLRYRPTRNFVYREGLRFYLIPYRQLFDWMHDPAKGTLSLQQMLPTESLGVYLQWVNGSAEPFGRERNDWLEDLNARAADLDRELGNPNIYAIYGAGRDTEAGYTVLWRRRDRWRHGEPLPGLGWSGSGDNLIPEASARMDGVLLLPADNLGRVEVAAHGAAGVVGHTPIVFHPRTQTELVPKYLTGHEVPFSTERVPPDITLALETSTEVLFGPLARLILERFLRLIPGLAPESEAPAP